MNINAIIGALKSPKTPARLKQGLMKKFGAQLAKAGFKGMSGLSATVHPNPKKMSALDKAEKKLRSSLLVAKGYHDTDIDQPNRTKKYDVYVTEGPKGTFTIDYPAKKYVGKIKGVSKTKAFLKPAITTGLRISYSTQSGE